MITYLKRTAIAVIILAGLSLSYIAVRPAPAQGSPLRQEADQAALVEHGRYMATILRCVTCHTPDQAEYTAETLTEEQIRTLALFPNTALDMDRLMGGGRVFSFGPSGSVTASNITSDEATGIGSWTDEELKATLQTGVTPEGRRMHGIMPVLTNLADSDVDAIIAYLRTVEPISNEVVNELEVTTPPGTPPDPPIVAPDPSEQSARGEYLLRNMNCSGCHTPTDPETRRPIEGKYLAGRDPFARDYGVVYAGNITPHEETGIGTWSDEEIARAITEGVRRDGRRLSLMPWQDFSAMTKEDIDAMVFYLMNDVPPVENSIPQTDLQDPYCIFEDGSSCTEAAEAEEEDQTMMIAAAVAAVIVLAGGAFFMLRRSGVQPA